MNVEQKFTVSTDDFRIERPRGVPSDVTFDVPGPGTHFPHRRARALQTGGRPGSGIRDVNRSGHFDDMIGDFTAQYFGDNNPMQGQPGFNGMIEGF